MDNKNIKIGIVTHYYKSSNYGGNLQAYALCKIIKNWGYEAEQLSVPFNYYKKAHFRKKKMKIFCKIIKSVYNAKHYKYYKNFKTREHAMIDFKKI